MKRAKNYRAVFVVSMTVLTAALIGGPASAQRTPAGGGVKPDVQVVAFPLPTGEWAVTSVYNKKVPRADAIARQKNLTQITGWKTHDLEIEDRGLGLQHRDGTKAVSGADKDIFFPDDPVMTSVTFQTPGNVVDFGNGTIDVMPWAQTFRDQNCLNLTYLLPQGVRFPFRGLRHYDSPDLSVDLAKTQPGSVTYVVQIKNHQLGVIALPRFQEATDTRNREDRRRIAGLKQRSRALGTSLVIAFALGAGALVYLWATRLSSGSGSGRV